MSYTKTTWQTGDIVTADKLNNIENGIENASGGGGGGVFAIHAIDDEVEETTTLDKTWQEIRNAMASGQIANIIYETDPDIESYYVWSVYAPADNVFVVHAITYFFSQDTLKLGHNMYVTNSADEYPVYASDPS